MSTPVDITSIGGAAFDVFIRAAHTIAKNDAGEEQIQFPLGGKVKVKSVIQSCGGGATNTSVGFSRLGLHAGFCGIIGNDEWGQGIQENLRKEGVNTDAAVIVEGETSSFSIILVDSASGKRTVLYSGNVNAHLSDAVFPKDMLCKSSWLFLNHLTDVSQVILDDFLDVVQCEKTKFAWNPGGTQIQEGYEAPLIKDLLQETKILFLNAEEAKTFTRSESIEEALKVGTSSGASVMCITDGGKGAYLSDGKNILFCPSLPETKVVDATGAGDGFAVGVTWAIMKGMSLSEAIQAGMISAASVISQVGTQAGLLTDTEIRSRLSETTLTVSSSPLS
jgi:sugar/nucleoside kinase (ribokinase family)